ncbi:prepilin peptidase [Campylobacter sp. LR196d]|nr:prepilin peptidase [Campylobacter sp. LR196d]KAA6228563.1 prepilin peptidase [Campylobacter sp. LR286c]
MNLAFLFVLSLIFSSFFICLTSRFCENKPLFSIRSYCFYCNHKLSFFTIIPIFSYIFLKGKCKYCLKGIPKINFLAEIIGAFLLPFSLYASKIANFSFIFFSLFLFMLFSLSLVDLKLKAVPNLILWLSFIIAFCVNYDIDFIFNACLCAGFLFLLKNFISFLKSIKSKDIQENLGDADIIIMASISGIFGFKFAFWVLFLACVLALPFFFFVKKIAFLPFISLNLIVYFLFLEIYK